MDFFTVTVIGLLVIISPGPDFLIVTQNSLNLGRSAGLETAIGISLANFCHVLLNIIGIGIIISESIFAFNLLKTLGALYLIYFGIASIKNSSNEKASSTTKQIFKNSLLSGFYCSILNPKACLFYLSLFSVILPASSSQYVRIFYGIWLCILALIWFVSVAYIFTNKRIKDRLLHWKSWIERISGMLLIALGLRLFLQE